jgi:hypothetical protein
MSNFKLNLPTDIPWERVCVTEDMIDKVVCDDRLPAKWQTSMAVFKYVPEDEYQLYPKYKITYLKVTATITGYQPLDQEIQGNIDWDGVDISTIPGLTDLLNSYNPCHGALLQVVVGPHDSSKVLLKNYPYFLDFEPKKRELYELATDTKEKQSRSIESLNITKSAGTTQSLEILDIDMGGGGVGVSGSYAGTGGGFNYTAPNGQWGTRRINADESLASRSSDVGQEKRETFSFSTQISQMYHLLDSYHLGTNRIVFFIQPRPHTLEEPSGFVRGPRPVDGIQEFFMVVAQPKNQEDFCISLRLDTSHLTKTPNMEYERKTLTSSLVSASIPTPKLSEDDLIAHGFTPSGKVALHTACAFGQCWDVRYLKWTTSKTVTETLQAPEGFVIESFDDIKNEHSNGTTNVFISDDGSSATITVTANGVVYENTGEDICLDCPSWDGWNYGNASRQISLNLRSTERTIQTGEEEVLMITTRGLCCCSSKPEKAPSDEYVVDFKDIPKDLKITNYFDDIIAAKIEAAGFKASFPKTHMDPTVCKQCDEKIKQISLQRADPKFTIRLANELSNYIKTETIKSLNNPTSKLKKFAETEFFAKQLELKMIQVSMGRKYLFESALKDIPKESIPKLEKYFRKKSKDITRKDILSLKAENLTKLTGIDSENGHKLKLGLMGVKFNKSKIKDSKGNKKNNVS